MLNSCNSSNPSAAVSERRKATLRFCATVAHRDGGVFVRSATVMQRKQRTVIEAVESFWSSVGRGADSECWNWKLSTNGVGYGMFFLSGRRHLCHRISWTLFNGAIPAGMCVLHKCDNPNCVNPSHLFLGTQGDNMRDCIAKGRRVTVAPTGEKCHLAKLTDADVVRIRSIYRRGKATSIAATYGVTKCTINKIIRRNTWKHI